MPGRGPFFGSNRWKHNTAERGVVLAWENTIMESVKLQTRLGSHQIPGTLRTVGKRGLLAKRYKKDGQLWAFVTSSMVLPLISTFFAVVKRQQFHSYAAQSLWLKSTWEKILSTHSPDTGIGTPFYRRPTNGVLAQTRCGADIHSHNTYCIIKPNDITRFEKSTLFLCIRLFAKPCIASRHHARMQHHSTTQMFEVKRSR